MTGTMRVITTDELKALLEREAPANESESGGYALVDVLSPDHFRAGHIPGSINIPLGDIPLDNNGRYLQLFGKDKKIIVYSASPLCELSTKAANQLRVMGYSDILDYSGGLNDWKSAGNAVEQETGSVTPAAESR